MAVAMAASNIASPDIQTIVAPVLSALPGAAASTEPPTRVMPSLSPILRQRVQLLASASSEPWIRLLSYEPAKVPQLTKVAQSGRLDPHPVSGEIEVDWDYDIDVKYKRIDQETLQTMVVLKELGLFFRLVYCTNDPDGGGDGWRVGEVGVADSSLLASFGGSSDIQEAEKAFRISQFTSNSRLAVNSSLAETSTTGWSAHATAAEDDDDDDDDYWARYDATPSRTPAMKRSPAPQAAAQRSAASAAGIQRPQSAEAEAAYFAQYDSVQPAMDNHDPDEEAAMIEHAEHVEPLPPLGLSKHQPAQTNAQATTTTNQQQTSTDGPVIAHPVPIKPDTSSHSSASHGSRDESWVLAQPRPDSSASSSRGSNASQTVARLEGAAQTRQQAEFGVKQHVARSIRSLFMLSRASGIDREEFERMVRTELDVLGMVEDDI